MFVYKEKRLVSTSVQLSSAVRVVFGVLGSEKQSSNSNNNRKRERERSVSLHRRIPGVQVAFCYSALLQSRVMCVSPLKTDMCRKMREGGGGSDGRRRRCKNCSALQVMKHISFGCRKAGQEDEPQEKKKKKELQDLQKRHSRCRRLQKKKSSFFFQNDKNNKKAWLRTDTIGPFPPLLHGELPKAPKQVGGRKKGKSQARYNTLK